MVQKCWAGHSKGENIYSSNLNVYKRNLGVFPLKSMCKTDGNGNAMLQSFLLKKETGSRYSRAAAMGKTGKKCLFFSIICSRCCKDYLFTLLYAAELALSRKNCQHADQKQFTR